MTAILMLVALTLFLMLESLLHRKQPDTAGTATHANLSKSPAILPSGLALARNHIWSKQEEDGTVKLGIDGFLSVLLGPPDEILLPSENGILRDESYPISIRLSEKVLRMQSPVLGRVTEINKGVLNNPAVVSKDPYGEGWLLRIRPVQALSTSLALANPGAWLREQVDRSLAFFRTQSGMSSIVTMQDGGMFSPGFLRNLTPEAFDEFSRAFATLQKGNS